VSDDVDLMDGMTRLQAEAILRDRYEEETEMTERAPQTSDNHPDTIALHRTYDTYVSQGMLDHEHGSLRPDDFITSLLNAGVVVRLASALTPPAPAEPVNCDAVYTERNRLVAALCKFLPSRLMKAGDAEEGWNFIVVIDGPTGQMSWHIPDSEMYLFDDVLPYVNEVYAWDGHTTEEKYERLAALAPDSAHQFSEPCPDCSGTGRKAETTCKACDGMGVKV
jgi:hypothetical protein